MRPQAISSIPEIVESHIQDRILEITGEGSMQGLLIEGVGGTPALTQISGFVRLSKMMVKSIYIHIYIYI
jgi:hypothetical protein